MEMKQMEDVVEGNTGKEERQHRVHLLLSCYQAVLLRLEVVLDNGMHNFVQLSIDCCPVEPTTVARSCEKQSKSERAGRIYLTVKY